MTVSRSIIAASHDGESLSLRRAYHATPGLTRPTPTLYYAGHYAPAPRFHRALPPHQSAATPTGGAWHEIKHDGFRVVARKDGERVRLYSRPGNDVTWR
jgi:ATP-dependent DNA ligase